MRVASLDAGGLDRGLTSSSRLPPCWRWIASISASPRRARGWVYVREGYLIDAMKCPSQGIGHCGRKFWRGSRFMAAEYPAVESRHANV